MNVEIEIKKTYGEDAEIDGILNPELYANSKIRIMWMLREPWFKGAWKLIQNEGVYSRIGASPTLQPMAYVTYSILNGYPNWSEMSYLRDKPEMAEVLRAIAYVNVKKCVGGTASDLGDIYSHFKMGEHILRFQVKQFKPDVVIGCNPFMHDVFTWDSSRSTPKNYSNLSYVSDAGQPLLIQSLHPSQRATNRADYIDPIIRLIEAEL